MTWNRKTWPCPNSSGARDTPLKVANSLVFTGMSTILLLAVYKNCGLPVWVFPPQGSALGSGSQELLTPHEMVAVCAHQPQPELLTPHEMVAVCAHQPQPESLQWAPHPKPSGKKLVLIKDDWPWMNTINSLWSTANILWNSQHQRRTLWGYFWYSDP